MKKITTNHTKDKGGHKMSVSMAVVPLLKDDVAKSFLKTLEQSQIVPYTDEQRESTNKKIAEILAKRRKK